MTDIRLFRIKYTGETIIGKVEKNHKDQISLKEAVMPIIVPQNEGKNTTGLTFIPVAQFCKVKDKISLNKDDCLIWNEDVDPQLENMYRSLYGKVILPDMNSHLNNNVDNIINLKPK